METIVNAALPVLAGMVIGYALAWFLAIRGLTKGVQVLLRTIEACTTVDAVNAVTYSTDIPAVD